MKAIAIIVLMLALAGCTTTSMNFMPGKLDLSTIDSSLLAECDLPVKLPKRRLTQADVEKFWSRDRKALTVCAKRHGFLGDAIKFRDKQLEGQKPHKER